MKTWKDLVGEAKKEVMLFQVKEVKELFDLGEDFILIDVREPDEFHKGRIPRSMLAPRGILEMMVEQNIKDLKKQIILHCAGGGRSAVAALSLKEMGYERVASMEGGFDSWVKAGYPVER